MKLLGLQDVCVLITEQVDSAAISTFTAGRLIPLSKDIGEGSWQSGNEASEIGCPQSGWTVASMFWSEIWL